MDQRFRRGFTAAEKTELWQTVKMVVIKIAAFHNRHMGCSVSGVGQAAHRILDLTNDPVTQQVTPPDKKPTLCAIAMPTDTNPHGDIFGGWLISQMDLAGSATATRRAKGRVVTVAITGMTFHRPVYVGDEVSCYAEVIEVGHTSLTVKIESWACRGISDEQIAVTDGVFTYVAVNADGKPRPVDTPR
jgi:acyl-CoA thioesterase YciA